LNTQTVALNGHRWLANNADSAFWHRVEIGDWEPFAFRLLDRFLDRNHSYIDVGAWIGPTLLYGSHIAQHCYALEPDPVAFSRLLENVQLNPSLRDRVTLSNACLAPRSGFARLGNKTSPNGGDSMSSCLFAGSPLHWEVSGVTLEDFVASHKIRDCTFIKMEGGEFDVLPAISEFLTSNKPTLYVSLHPRFLDDAIQKVKGVEEVLSRYRHIYTPDLKEVPADFVSNPLTFRSCYELVLTDAVFQR
jgi:FkbM family methyltransferase